MTPTSCPRCVAERRARRVRVAVNVVAGVAIVLGVVPCLSWWLLRGIQDTSGPEMPPQVLRAQAIAGRAVAAALALACGVFVLRALADHLTRRAAAPLPPPAVGPLATYREGPTAECPRHPFAG